MTQANQTPIHASLAELNACPERDFVRQVGPVFEHSPWIAEETVPARPFGGSEELLTALCATVRNSSLEKKLALICAHPDLAGRVALTAQSAGEQAAAGLTSLTPEEMALFQRQNQAYRRKFGFPFIICARLNQKEAILEGFARRLPNSREQEIETALKEIFKIAGFRLGDLLKE